MVIECHMGRRPWLLWLDEYVKIEITCDFFSAAVDEREARFVWGRESDHTYIHHQASSLVYLVLGNACVMVGVGDSSEWIGFDCGWLQLVLLPEVDFFAPQLDISAPIATEDRYFPEIPRFYRLPAYMGAFDIAWW